jgi:hypothetical protein
MGDLEARETYADRELIMRLDPTRTMFGVSAAILKNCARELREFRHFGLDEFCEAIGAPCDEALPVLEKMVSEGYVLKNGNCYEPQDKKLSRLALATIAEKGLDRTEADRLLNEVVRRAEIINSQPERYLCKIVRIAVFGSDIKQKAVLGDLDVAVEINELPRKMLPGESYISMYRKAGPSQKAKSFLRMRNWMVSIHDFHELKRLSTRFKLVFELKQ